MNKVELIGECWMWKSTLVDNGNGQMYPQFWNEGKTVYAHRYAWSIVNEKKISRSQFVCHKCDNPSCVNPDHLFLGSHRDNMKDMINKNRQAKGDRHGAKVKPESIMRGERNPRAKLTNEIVEEIRRTCKRGDRSRGGLSQRALAKKYGVSHSVIGKIMNGKLWGDIPVTKEG